MVPHVWITNLSLTSFPFFGKRPPFFGFRGGTLQPECDREPLLLIIWTNMLIATQIPKWSATCLSSCGGSNAECIHEPSHSLRHSTHSEATGCPATLWLRRYSGKEQLGSLTLTTWRLLGSEWGLPPNGLVCRLGWNIFLTQKKERQSFQSIPLIQWTSVQWPTIDFSGADSLKALTSSHAGGMSPKVGGAAGLETKELIEHKESIASHLAFRIFGTSTTCRLKGSSSKLFQRWFMQFFFCIRCYH